MARRWWSVVGERAFDRLGDLMHEDIVVVSKISPGVVLEGKDAVVRHIEETLAGHLYEATTTGYYPVDEDRIVVEGRIRWIDEERVIRDDPVTWAMAFREGKLARFTPARTKIEAETILASQAS